MRLRLSSLRQQGKQDLLPAESHADEPALSGLRESLGRVRDVEHGKALVASPLQNVYAGDFYAPQDNGRQETEAFKDIKYEEDKDLGISYSRWAPAFYQRLGTARLSISLIQMEK